MPAVALALPQAGVLLPASPARRCWKHAARGFARTARAKGLSSGKVLWRHSSPRAGADPHHPRPASHSSRHAVLVEKCLQSSRLPAVSLIRRCRSAISSSCRSVVRSSPASSSPGEFPGRSLPDPVTDPQQPEKGSEMALVSSTAPEYRPPRATKAASSASTSSSAPRSSLARSSPRCCCRWWTPLPPPKMQIIHKPGAALHFCLLKPISSSAMPSAADGRSARTAVNSRRRRRRPAARSVPSPFGGVRLRHLRNASMRALRRHLRAPAHPSAMMLWRLPGGGRRRRTPPSPLPHSGLCPCCAGKRVAGLSDYVLAARALGNRQRLQILGSATWLLEYREPAHRPGHHPAGSRRSPGKPQLLSYSARRRRAGADACRCADLSVSPWLSPFSWLCQIASRSRFGTRWHGLRDLLDSCAGTSRFKDDVLKHRA